MTNPNYYEQQFDKTTETDKKTNQNFIENHIYDENKDCGELQNKNEVINDHKNVNLITENNLETKNLQHEKQNIETYIELNLINTLNESSDTLNEPPSNSTPKITTNTNGNTFKIEETKKEELILDLSRNQRPQRNKSYMNLRCSKNKTIVNKETAKKEIKNSIQGISDITQNQLLMCQTEFKDKKIQNVTQNSSPLKTKEDQIDSYNKLIEGLKYLKMMDWDSLNPSVFKNSPQNNPPLTSICYWFMTCSSYFIKRDPNFLIQLLDVLLESLSDHKEVFKQNFTLSSKKKFDEENQVKDLFISSYEEYVQNDESYKETFDGVNWENLNPESDKINDELEKQFASYKIKDSYNFDDFKKSEGPYSLNDDTKICFLRSLVYNLACKDN